VKCGINTINGVLYGCIALLGLLVGSEILHVGGYGHEHTTTVAPSTAKPTPIASSTTPSVVETLSATTTISTANETSDLELPIIADFGETALARGKRSVQGKF
jgi:hypothetical protein